MEYTRLGNTGLKVSRLCLGCMTYGEPGHGMHPWTLGEEQSRPFIPRALEAGINFFDTANVYSAGTSEEILGRALKDFAQRDEVVIATKVHWPDAARGRTAAGCRARRSWRRSTTACGGSAPTMSTSTRSTAGTTKRRSRKRWRRCTTSCKAGKARYIGASSMYAWQFCKALYLADRTAGRASSRCRTTYNLLYREEEREMLPLCRDRGHRRHSVEPAGARPAGAAVGQRSRHFARGDRQGRRHALRQDPGRRPCGDRARRTRRRGARRVASQVALAWLLHKPVVTAPIIGASKPQHLEDALAALSLKLSPEEVAMLEDAYVPHPVAGFS